MSVEIPEHISENEKIVRILYYPNYFKSDGSIKSNAFRPPPDLDEISVIRLDYSSETFCKALGKKYEKPEDNRAYHGLSCLTVNEIYSTTASIVYTPKIENIAHSDIKIGYIPVRGQQIPTKYKIIIDELARKSRFYQDPEIHVYEWTGEKVI